MSGREWDCLAMYRRKAGSEWRGVRSKRKAGPSFAELFSHFSLLSAHFYQTRYKQKALPAKGGLF
jgi:hypothetical protein